MSGELLPSRGLRFLLHVFRGQSALTDCLNAFQMPQPAGRFMPRPSSSTRHCPFMRSPHLIAIYVHMYMCCPMQSAVLRVLLAGERRLSCTI